MRRTEFEHSCLPVWLYSHETDVIGLLLHEGPELLRKVYATLEYKQFHIFTEKFDIVPSYYVGGGDVIVILRLDLPDATSMLECRHIYLCESRNNGQLLYFTSELSAEGSFYLCAWTKKHTHLVFSMDLIENETEAVLRYYRQYAGFEPVED